MNSADVILLPSTVIPGQTVEISVNLVSPALPGKYRGNWLLRNPLGETFGTGTSANKPIWADIEVADQEPEGIAYNFTTNICTASWSSAAGLLPCAGTDGNPNGFVTPINNAVLEGGIVEAQASLLMSPQNINDGYIKGVYPPIVVQQGDRFKAKVSCENGSVNCLVLFKLGYQIGTGPEQTYWVIGEWNDGQFFTVDIDLSELAGKNVSFVIKIESLGSASGDRAVWVTPRITRTYITQNVRPIRQPTRHLYPCQSNNLDMPSSEACIR